MIEEIIEETIKVFAENELDLNVNDIAMSVIDSAYSHGLIKDEELDTAGDYIIPMVEYYLA
jgi:hypothetical protein